MLDKMYTLQEAATILRKSRRSMYNYIKDGRLKASKLPGCTDWRIKEEDLKAFINGDVNI